MIEAVSMASFFGVIALMIYNGVKLESLVPMLSAVAMAAVRLLPSVNRISLNLANIAYFEPSLNKMSEKLQEIQNNGDVDFNKNISPEPLGLVKKLDTYIKMQDLDYQYPNTENKVLDAAEIQIKNGSSIGIIGSSGAGKTTAVDVLLGLLIPNKGGVYIDGVSIRDDIGGWLNQIGYIPQNIFMLDGSIRENVAFEAEEDNIDDERIWEVLREAALDDFVRTLPDEINTEIGERGVRLSGGQRQRIEIARALYSNPSILFFDEATSALDNDTEAAIMQSIHELHGKKTLIIIAHRLTTLEKCDYIYRVNNGKIIMEKGITG